MTRILAIFLFAIYCLTALAQTETEQAFATGKTFAQGKTQGIFNGITPAGVQDKIPQYNVHPPASEYFVGGKGETFGYGNLKVQYCGNTAITQNLDSKTQQECKAVNLLSKHHNTYQVSKDNPMFAKAKKAKQEAESMFQSLGKGLAGNSTDCTSKVVKTEDTYTTEACSNLAEVVEKQCTMSRIVNIEERDKYQCEEVKGTIFKSTCQNAYTVQCQDKQYNLYDMQGNVIGWWKPDGTVYWKSSYGKWVKNSPTPPKYAGKIFWGGRPWYFDQYHNIFYDDGTNAYKVATYVTGHALKALDGTVHGAWFEDGSLYLDGIWGSWRIAQPKKPQYKGAARWVDGNYYDVTWENYCAGCGGVTLNISGNSWSRYVSASGQFQPSQVKGQALYNGTWYDINLNNCVVVDPSICLTISGNTWTYGSYSGTFRPSQVKGQAYYEGSWYDVGWNNCVISSPNICLSISGNTWTYNQTQSGPFTYYPSTPPEFPYEISWGGLVWYADYNGNIYSSNKQLVARAVLDSGLL
ncbi:MAG: hypothetical protein ACK8QZ_02635, partial [Anaerolineales bacterium]